MAELRKQIADLMRRVRTRGNLPSSKAIVDEAFKQLDFGELQPDEVLTRFNELLRRFWQHTLVVLERYEEQAYAEGIPRELIDQYPDLFAEAERVASQEGFRASIVQIFASWYPMLRLSFLSISQSRMQRGGRDFELQIERLFDLARIPYHEQEREHRTDLILPDLATHKRNRNITAIVSVKRTLRERWAEVAQELFALRSPNVYLFTADENISQAHVRQICQTYNIYLVVWDSVKAARFSAEPLVLSYSAWATEHLAILRRHW